MTGRERIFQKSEGRLTWRIFHKLIVVKAYYLINLSFLEVAGDRKFSNTIISKLRREIEAKSDR